MKQLRILQFWFFLLFCSYLSLTPAPPQSLLYFSDKLLHASGYLALYLSYSLAYSPPAQAARKFLMLLGYSFVIEISQHFISSRGFAWLDIMANAVGLLAGLIIFRISELVLARRIP